MRRTILLLAATAAILATVAAGLALYAALLWRSPAFTPAIVVEVRRGEPFLALARRLADAGAIADARLFTLLARWRGDDRRVRSGEYELAGNATGPEVLAALVSGKPFTLAPEDDQSAPTPREVLAQLRNWAAVPGKQMTLTLRGVDYPVIFRHPDDENGPPAVEARPWIHYDQMVDADIYLCTFRFLGL